MAEWIAVGLAAGILSWFGYWTFVGTWRSLNDYLDSKLSPDEIVRFRCYATVMQGKLPWMIFGMRSGRLLITSDRILFARPVLMPFVDWGRGFLEVIISTIDQMSLDKHGAVALDIGREQMFVVAYESRVLPFLPGNVGRELVTAINDQQATAA
ncbi:MAG TPA: hypothetical protein VMR52_02955 [Dehalococcoidia bacterium]|nr:hypothetical protein [Dehalococcoidia bacterium]